MSDNADVLVVGGGVIGMSCAWRLAQRGLRVTLAERQHCGSGGSGASLGVLMPAPATRHGPPQAFQRHSLTLFPEMADELRALTGCDIAYQRIGMLEVLRNEARRIQAVKETELACAEWPAIDDEPVMQVLSNAEAAELEPTIVFDAEGARLCRATAIVDVGKYITALRRACAVCGVTIREGCAIGAIDMAGGSVRGARCEDDYIAAKSVLVATGAWTEQLGAPIANAAPIRPTKGQALTLRVSDAAPTRMVKRRTAYLIPRDAGEIYVGSTTEPDAGYDDRPSADGIATLIAGALQLSPALAGAAFINAWAGIRPESLQQSPFMGAVAGVRGLFIAAGHYKTGIGLSAATGVALSEMIVDGVATRDLTAFAPLSA